MKRRVFLGTTAAVTLAGCTTSETNGEGTAADDGDDAADAASEESVTTLSPGETFDEFEDLEAWEAISGTLYRTDEVVYTGSQAAFVETDDSEEQARIGRELSPPVDFTGLSPGVALATNASADVLIQLIDDDGDRVDFRQQPGGNTDLVRKNFGIAHVEGDPDLEAITAIQISVWAEEETNAQLVVDDLHVVSRPETGKLLLQFDGGYESVYEDGYPLLSEYGYTATVFVPTERIRGDSLHEGGRLTEHQLESLHADGWTIASHAAHGLDLTALEGRSPDDEILRARQWLEDNGYVEGARYFSYPQNRYTDEILDLVENTYELAFAGRQPAQGLPANPYLCSRVTDPAADEAIEILDRTAEYGGLTALCYVDVSPDTQDALGETLEHVTALEAAGDLEVLQPHELELLID